MSFKTVLVALGLTAVSVILVFGVLRSETLLSSSSQPVGNESSPHSTQNNDAGDELQQECTGDSSYSPSSEVEAGADSSLMFFGDTHKIFLVDTSKPELERRFLSSVESFVFKNYFQLSDDKRHVYFQDSKSIKKLELEDGSVDDVSLPDFSPAGFIFKKPDFKSIIYVKATSEGGTSFCHFNLEDSSVIGDYPHKCPPTYSPQIIQQFSDGSKFLYTCKGRTVYLKDMGDPEQEDQELFTVALNYKFFLSPDNSKAIVYGLHGIYWTIHDVANPNPRAMGKRVYFNQNVCPIRAHLFSNNQNTLNIIINPRLNDRSSVLFKIDDFEAFLRNDYPNARSPYELNGGRLIAIQATEPTSESEN